MKKIKFKIFMTNISRIIMSFLFVNLNWFLNTKVLKVSAAEDALVSTCYVAGPSSKSPTIGEQFSNIFIIVAPIIIILIIVLIIVHKHRKNKKKDNIKENKEDVK